MDNGPLAKNQPESVTKANDKGAPPPTSSESVTTFMCLFFNQASLRHKIKGFCQTKRVSALCLA